MRFHDVLSLETPMKKIATLAVAFALVAGSFAAVGCGAPPTTKATTPPSGK